jgi:hypothetical protein
MTPILIQAEKQMLVKAPGSLHEVCSSLGISEVLVAAMQDQGLHWTDPKWKETLLAFEEMPADLLQE